MVVIAYLNGDRYIFLLKDRQFHIVLFSLVFAGILWTSVNLGNMFTVTVKLPVSIQNVPKDLALASFMPDSLKMTLRGNGWNILHFLLSPDNRYSIDISTFRNNSIVVPSQNLKDDPSISSPLTIVSTMPESLLIRLEERTTKRIPVLPDLNVSYRQGFGSIGRPSMVPDSITISGAPAILAGVTQWKTIPIILTDINTPIHLAVPLSENQAFEIDRPSISIAVDVDVQPIAERTIEDIPLEILQVPERRTIVLIPPKISIIIRSGVNTVSDLQRKDFQAYIDYRSILLDTSGWLKPIINAPENVQIVHFEPERVQYVLRK